MLTSSLLTYAFGAMCLLLLLSLSVGSVAVRRQNQRLRWWAISLMMLAALLGGAALLLARSIP